MKIQMSKLCGHVVLERGVVKDIRGIFMAPASGTTASLMAIACSTFWMSC